MLTLEGGYNVVSVARGLGACLAAMLGAPPPPEGAVTRVMFAHFLEPDDEPG